MLVSINNQIRQNWQRILVHIIGISFVCLLIWDGLTNNLTINPIQALTQRTGRYALYFLLVSLACTPINTLFGLRGFIKIRRTLGLYAFFFASIHFFLFVGVDYQLNFRLIWDELISKFYIQVGFVAFILITALALTSFRWWMKVLGKNWKRLHRLVYLIGLLVIIHYFWVAKGDLFQLSGDIFRPLIFGGILIVLLMFRVPIIRKIVSNNRVIHLRNKFKSLMIQRQMARK